MCECELLLSLRGTDRWQHISPFLPKPALIIFKLITVFQKTTSVHFEVVYIYSHGLDARGQTCMKHKRVLVEGPTWANGDGLAGYVCAGTLAGHVAAGTQLPCLFFLLGEEQNSSTSRYGSDAGAELFARAGAVVAYRFVRRPCRLSSGHPQVTDDATRPATPAGLQPGSSMIAS